MRCVNVPGAPSRAPSSSFVRFRSRWPARAALTLALALAPGLAAESAAAAPRKGARPPSGAAVRTGLENVERQVRSFTLANGLQFLVVERRQAPVFSFQTVVNAGSANDAVGTTGLAHMMEHMAFKGTAIVGTTDYERERSLLEREEAAWGALLDERRKGARADTSRLRALEKAFGEAQEAARGVVVSNEFQKILERSGAQNSNAFTANDITAYFYSMPSNRLELWAAMEGGRMAQPVFREFYKERDVVYEERRMRYESSPVGRLAQEFIHASYVAHPYGFGGIGHPSDLTTFSRTQGDQFFRRNYVAKNMTVAVVGDVQLDDVRRLAEAHFGGLSDAPAPPPIDTVEPEQKAERRVLLEDAAQPVILIGWHIPAATDPAYASAKALADLLGGGNHARLVKTLVKEKKIATQLSAFTGFPGERYANQLVIFAIPAAGQDPLEVEKEIYRVLDEVAGEKPFTREELDGYKVRVKAQKIGAAESNAGLAGELAQAQALHGDWRQFFREQERVQSLSVDDVMAGMKRWFTRSNRTVAMIVSPSGQASNQGGR
jgi:predicted Zn-dependent peptidase